MAKTDNLNDFMTDLADSIREATGETESINAQSFSTRITGLGAGKQDKLVSGENIKTINGESILGSGDITISGGSSSGGGASGVKKEVITLYGSDPLVMKPDVVYWVSETNHFTVQSFEAPLAEQDTYDIFTAVLFLGIDEDSQTTITLPDYVHWANGVIPETISGYMELSISRISDGYGIIGEESYFAVLTPFKAVE